MTTAPLLQERSKQIHRKGSAPFEIDCNKDSLAGAVSQRACVFCGSRVVLYPIADPRDVTILNCIRKQQRVSR